MKRYNKKDDVSYSLGTTLTIELLNRKLPFVRKIYFHSKLVENEVTLNIKKICNENNIPIIVSDKPFNILSNKENCFVIGEFTKFDSHLDKDSNHVVLVNPSNSGNLGTIIRSMVGFNVTNLAIILPSCDIFDTKTIRASMGAVFNINFELFNSFDEYLSKYKNNNIYPFMLQAKKSISEVEFKKPYSLVFGNEATGLPIDFLKIGTSVIIKHSNLIDSLNLPIALSIALHYVTIDDFKS